SSSTTTAPCSASRPAGRHLFTDVFPNYGSLLPVAAAAVQRRIGAWSMGGLAGEPARGDGMQRAPPHRRDVAGPRLRPGGLRPPLHRAADPAARAVARRLPRFRGHEPPRLVRLLRVSPLGVEPLQLLPPLRVPGHRRRAPPRPRGVRAPPDRSL